MALNLIGPSVTGLLVLPEGARFNKGGPASLDRSTYRYQCLTTLIKSKAPQVGRADPNYTGLYCMGFELVGEKGLMSEIEVIYEGCLNNVTPPNVFATSSVLQSASCTSGDNTVEIQYYTTSFSVAGITGPDGSLNVQATGTPRIISARGPFSDLASLLGFFTLESIIQRSKEELVPGRWYQETVTVTPTYVANI